jgi:hypothetical protein
MQRSTPFARAHAMFAAIAAAMGGGMSRELAIAQAAPYQSRGKGRGTPSRNFYKSRSRYMPHYGAKESAKAVKRLAAMQPELKQAA